VDRRHLSRPVFLYGLSTWLSNAADVRKLAFRTLMPIWAESAPATLGASASARGTSSRVNLWLRGVTWVRHGPSHERSSKRGAALAFQVGDQVQVSCNLVAPLVVGTSVVFDR